MFEPLPMATNSEELVQTAGGLVMISGLYSAATAMDAAAARHETSAENLAHAHLPGYRRRTVHQTTFRSAIEAVRGNTAGLSETLGTSVGAESNRQIRIDFSHGPLKQTGRQLDFALQGDGFFTVEGPDGPLYTRNGSFLSHPDGRLVTVDGLSVNGANGTLQLPPNATAENIDVSGDGRLSVGGVEFGQLRIVEIANRSNLTPVGASLFRADETADIEPAEDFVLQGFVEAANVAHMDELVNIMVASRQYEAAQRALRTIDEALGKHVNGN